MPQLDETTLHLPQPTIHIAVDYYDDTERGKFRRYPTAATIERILQDGVDIRCEQFLTYYLFHKERPGKPGWRNYREVGTKIGHAISELSEWVDFNENLFRHLKTLKAKIRR